MPKTLADGRTKLTWLEDVPVGGLESVTATQLNAGIDLSCSVLASPYAFGPSGSESLAEKALCDEGKSTTFGESNFVVTMSFFRYLLATGQTDPLADVAYETFAGKGTHGVLFERWGPKSREPWASGDEVRFAAEVTADDAQAPTERTGYIKFVQPMGVDGESAQRFPVAAGV